MPIYQVYYLVDCLTSKAEAAVAGICYGPSEAPKSLSYDEVDVALNDPRVQAVFVCTPTPTHHEVIVRALEAKKHVFAEKPVGSSIGEIDRVYQAARRAGCHLLCGYNRRFDPALNQIKDAVASGKVGRVLVVKQTARDNPRPSLEFLKTSGGFVHDSGCHEINLLRWIVGEDPREVYAQGVAYDPGVKSIGDIDTLMMTFKFASGVMATVDLHRQAVYGYDQRVEVYGDAGAVCVENQPTNGFCVASSTGVTRQPIQHSFQQRFAEAYVAELRHFAAILTEGAPPAISWEDCRRDHFVATAAMLSIERG